jgi:transketolase N-terminal domain/subunit
LRTATKQDLDQLCVNTIRTLAIDAIQKADSGHLGTPMGMAPTVYCLWQRILRFDPQDPIWPNRDRFVLSSGHASMLLYTMLHLTGTKAVDPDYEIPGKLSVTLDDLKTFRQLGSRCAGHPKYHWTSGVETTTGPLGQGVATSVGMAIARKWLAARYNRPGFNLFDYNVYAVCGDGCLMEGVSSEAASLAGHLKLNNMYEGGRMLFLGLGTGLGSGVIADGVLQPMELAHLPYRGNRTFEEYVGIAGLKRLGEQRWRQHALRIMEQLKNALQVDYVVLGGGNSKRFGALPAGVRHGDNSNAFRGGFRLWLNPHKEGMKRWKPKFKSHKSYRIPRAVPKGCDWVARETINQKDSFTIARVRMKSTCQRNSGSPEAYRVPSGEFQSEAIEFTS